MQPCVTSGQVTKNYVKGGARNQLPLTVHREKGLLQVLFYLNVDVQEAKTMAFSITFAWSPDGGLQFLILNKTPDLDVTAQMERAEM